MFSTLLLLMPLALTSTIDASPAGVREVPASAKGFAYDAVDDTSKRRKAPLVSNLSEDQLLNPARRSRMVSSSRDLVRNFSIAAWAIRRHLDYVTSFTFHSRTGNKPFDAEVEKLWVRWSKRINFDVAGRHRCNRFLRLAEARRVVDGDFGVLKLSAGTVQGIEGDRIRQPAGEAPGTWQHGVKRDDNGRARAYALWSRMTFGGFQFERTVSASNLYLHGCYDRFDQVRGISPLASALNNFRDVYENFDYTLAKQKVTNLFALAFFRKVGEDSAGDVSGGLGSDGTSEAKGGYDVDFGKGPLVLDLDPGDEAKFLESQHPSMNSQEFSKLIIMCAMKALDLPFSFFDESHTNFFGSRGAWMHYERSCEPKREDLQELLDWLTLWKLQQWVLDGSLVLPPGMLFGDLLWEHVPQGTPWWDPAKEIRGDLMAIGAALDNPENICKRAGTGDVYGNIDATARVLAYAKEKGVPLSFTPVAAPMNDGGGPNNGEQQNSDGQNNSGNSNNDGNNDGNGND